MNTPLTQEQMSTYLAQLSHEMRTPLNSILGFTHLLSEQCTDPAYLDWLNHIRHHAQHLVTLVGDIIDHELLNHQQVSLCEEAVDVYALVQLVQQGLQPQAIIGQLSLSCHIDQHCPHIWRADRRKLKQILINLIGNAIKFTPPQGHVHVHISQVAAGLRISVADTGVGIHTDALSQLFTPYYHNHNHLNQQGIGIGLDITRRLIELMNGEILVNSQPEDGAEFIIILPLNANPTLDTEPTDIQPLPKLLAATSILLVDDDALHHEVIHRLVQPLPIVVQSAYTCEQALTLYRNQPASLVLIDYQLSDGDGITLAKQIYQLASHHSPATNTHLVILSAQGNTNFEQTLLDGTITAWLTKPIQLSTLIQLANEHHLNQPQQIIDVPELVSDNTTDTVPASITLEKNQLPSYLQELWPEFIHELRSGIQHCQQLLTQRKMTEIMTKAHQLKGQSMVFQQRHLIQLLEQLELAAQNKQDTLCQHHLQSLIHLNPLFEH